MGPPFLLICAFLLSSSYLFQTTWGSTQDERYCNVYGERSPNRQSSLPLQNYLRQVLDSGLCSPGCCHSIECQECNRHEEPLEDKSDFYKQTGYELEVPDEALVEIKEEIVDYEKPQAVEDTYEYHTLRQGSFLSNTNQPNNNYEIISDQSNYQCKILDTPYNNVQIPQEFSWNWQNQANIQPRDEIFPKMYYRPQENFPIENCRPSFGAHQHQSQHTEFPVSSYPQQKPLKAENQHNIFNYYQSPYQKHNPEFENFPNDNCPVLQEYGKTGFPQHGSQSLPSPRPQDVLNWQNQPNYYQTPPQVIETGEIASKTYYLQDKDLPNSQDKDCPPEFPNNQFQFQQGIVESRTNIYPYELPVSAQHPKNIPYQLQKKEEPVNILSYDCPVSYEETTNEFQPNIPKEMPFIPQYQQNIQKPSDQIHKDEPLVNIQYRQNENFAHENCPILHEQPKNLFQQYINEPSQIKYPQENLLNIPNQRNFYDYYQHQQPIKSESQGFKNEPCPLVNVVAKNEFQPYPLESTPDIYKQPWLYHGEDRLCTQQTFQNQNKLHGRGESLVNIPEQKIENVKENCPLSTNQDWYYPETPLEVVPKVQGICPDYESIQKGNIQENQYNYILSAKQWEQMMEELSQVKIYQKEILETCFKAQDQLVGTPCWPGCRGIVGNQNFCQGREIPIHLACQAFPTNHVMISREGYMYEKQLPV